MSGSAVLFVAGRIIWAGDLKQTKTGSPMRGVLVAVEDQVEGQEPSCPAIFVRLFGPEAEHVARGDWLSAEGAPEASIRERDGKLAVNLSIMAKWCRLTGHAGQRQRKSDAAKNSRSGQEWKQTRPGMGQSEQNESGPPEDFFAPLD